MRTQLFQYGRTNGIIHELIARTVANDEGIEVAPEAVVVTTGCQEAMLLTLRALFAHPEDTLLVSSPCYVGITGVARLLGIRVRPVPEGPAGPDPEGVLAAARAAREAGERPRAFYVVPDFANPSGTSMSLTGRRRLLRVAEEEDLLVLEDDPYGFFVRTGSARPTLKALDTGRRVVHLGSFAKTALPGARVGYVIADQEVIDPAGRRSLLADELSKIKSMTTVNTSAVSQAVIGGLLVESDCRLRDANAEAIAYYRGNMDTLLDELERHFSRGAPRRAGHLLEPSGRGLLRRRHRALRRRPQGTGDVRAYLRCAVDPDERLPPGRRRYPPAASVVQCAEPGGHHRGRRPAGRLHHRAVHGHRRLTAGVPTPLTNTRRTEETWCWHCERTRPRPGSGCRNRYGTSSRVAAAPSRC
ncbi:PLP-dependent aminotransferase family protein [Streptomyces somaliensis]|nr:PLP-dependent aminotransferase family protein [Streptomyces somaliensis]